MTWLCNSDRNHSRTLLGTSKTKAPSDDVPKFKGLGRLQGKTLFTTVEIDLFRLLDSYFFLTTTFILSYANCNLPIRDIPVRGSVQFPSALASDPMQIILAETAK